MNIEPDQTLERSEQLRQRVLKQAFAGELVPQDPEDEGAGVLLGSERGKMKTTKCWYYMEKIG